MASRTYGDGSVYFNEARQRWEAAIPLRSIDGKRNGDGTAEGAEYAEDPNEVHHVRE